ncbi:MAG: hypothetical protein QM817_30535 [Archangium sp.]
MRPLTVLLARVEEQSDVDTPLGLEALPAWLRFIVADVVAQVLEGERAVLGAARRAVLLETSAEGRQLAERQLRAQERHVAFFVDARRRLAIERPVNPHLRELLCDASSATELPALLIGTHLVIETLGHSLFGASAALLSSQSDNRFFSVGNRCTLGELAMAMERLQRDESRHVAYGVARLREERSKMTAERRARFDADVASWRARLAELFTRLPLLVLLRPWLELHADVVLAQFDARARAVLAS